MILDVKAIVGQCNVWGFIQEEIDADACEGKTYKRRTAREIRPDYAPTLEGKSEFAPALKGYAPAVDGRLDYAPAVEGQAPAIEDLALAFEDLAPAPED